MLRDVFELWKVAPNRLGEPKDGKTIETAERTLGQFEKVCGNPPLIKLTRNDGLKFRDWLAAIAVLAIAGGLVLAVVVDPLIGALHGPFPELWLALAAEVAVAALFCSTMLVLVGRWAIIPTWTLFVILGNTSSGGAVAQPLLPPFYAFVGRFLPPGATVSIVRTAVYFRRDQHLEPFIVQAVWLVGTLAALLISARRLGRGPAQ